VPTHLALLRGINLGSRNRVSMPELREVVASLGHADVATYIQSGNVVFSAAKGSGAALAAELERAIAERLRVECSVVVLSRRELARVARSSPYEDEPNAKAVHAVFLRQQPSAGLKRAASDATRLAAEAGGRDEARIVGRTLFLHTPDGFGRSELAKRLMREVGADGTARNWATVTKLREMLDAS
jgi:uncharacterized protein (DUF1697 family)